MLVLLAACTDSLPQQQEERPESVPSLRLVVLGRYPHDARAFTQGLVWHDGRMFESTGLLGRSTMREVNYKTGALIQQVYLDETLFGEGLAVADGQLYQLTWTAQQGLIWSTDALSAVGDFTYVGEGWGLCFDGAQFVMSNGSDMLFFRNRDSFQLERTVRVRHAGNPVFFINELECAEGRVLANVLGTSRVVRIDPQSGAVEATVSLDGLLSYEEEHSSEGANGIAYSPESGHFFVTGKLWPWVFEVAFVEAEQGALEMKRRNAQGEVEP